MGYYSDLLYLGFSDMVSSLRKAIQEVFLVPKRVVGGRLSGPAPEDLALSLMCDVWVMGILSQLGLGVTLAIAVSLLYISNDPPSSRL